MSGKILKFQCVREYLKTKEYADSFAAAVGRDDYDQMRVIKDFKAFTGSVYSGFKY